MGVTREGHQTHDDAMKCGPRPINHNDTTASPPGRRTPPSSRSIARQSGSNAPPGRCQSTAAATEGKAEMIDIPPLRETGQGFRYNPTNWVTIFPGEGRGRMASGAPPETEPGPNCNPHVTKRSYDPSSLVQTSPNFQAFEPPKRIAMEHPD